MRGKLNNCKEYNYFLCPQGPEQFQPSLLLHCRDFHFKGIIENMIYGEVPFQYQRKVKYGLLFMAGCVENHWKTTLWSIYRLVGIRGS